MNIFIYCTSSGIFFFFLEGEEASSCRGSSDSLPSGIWANFQLFIARLERGRCLLASPSDFLLDPAAPFVVVVGVVVGVVVVDLLLLLLLGFGRDQMEPDPGGDFRTVVGADVEGRSFLGKDDDGTRDGDDWEMLLGPCCHDNKG